MRAFKLLLITLLVLVTALFGFTQFQEKASGKDIGPTISCPQEILDVSVSDGEEALLAGITASDKQDGNLTDHILIQGVSRQITDKMTQITYLVFDSDGNSASATRTIRYTDYESPRFAISKSLVYNNTLSIALLDRLHAVDCIDGDITNNIRVSSLTSTSDSEIYTIDIQVTNSLSDTARLTLPLVIYSSVSSRHAVINLTDYLVYLNQGASFNAKKYLVSVIAPNEEECDLSEIKIEGAVDTAAPGTYMVYYRYPYEGTTALAVLTVVVQ